MSELVNLTNEPPAVGRVGSGELTVGSAACLAVMGALHTVTASTTCGCMIHHIRLQAPSHTVTASMSYGCRAHDIRLQACLAVMGAR